jgi:predicted rRNA methylase YqxC with S4 and FtsJ domains
VRDAAQRLGLQVRGQAESPLVGAAGNREYLLHLALA